ncbi:hypothetical protein DSL72_008376 [Monilinia vaccinii-corymbosi]|uniref:Uncharacterized protein n=1 Tax=Monilinia vaccinii-corymbosi TaxID=61207 RepID=A0A8A3PKU3_9HELO|nr:hypothetical protein DSL72_008376 [Monilinia vaccinii-corymbosi]
MSAFLVFCTAEMSNETITAFQTQSTSARSAPESPWILQKTPSEGVHGPELTLPLPDPSFPTGFKDATPEALQKFMEENVIGRHAFPDYRGSIAWNEFVVLDSRSAEDNNTCVVYHRVQSMPDDSAGDEWDAEKLISEWRVWRVKFLMAWWLIAGLNNNDDVMLDVMEDEKDTYTDKDGVLQMPYMEHDEHEYPDLQNRVPWGPAP